MALFQDFSYNKSFSQLAKESKFTFNLYRGRVDWRKLEMLDVDRIIRDQDVEMLNIHIYCVTNCNLESEYDVKILDPNFIKLFRLAQLLIDFLLHCKQYLEHCIKLAHDSLETSNKEVEMLRRQVQARKSEVKQLKKKVKEVRQQLFHSAKFPSPTFECSLCGKFFMSEKFLEGHHSRRHILTPWPLALKTPNIFSEHQQKKLKQNEETKKESEKFNIFDGGEKIGGDTVKERSLSQENCERASTSTAAVKEAVLQPVANNASKQEGTTNESASKEKEVKEVDAEWQRRLEERESVWRTRLSDLDQAHKRQVQQLQDRLESSQLHGQDVKKDLEERLEKALNKFEQVHLESKKQINGDNSTTATFAVKNDDENLLKIHQDENKNGSKIKIPPPFQKRKAFVSQKTKTIQDEDFIESSQVNKSTNDLVQIIQIGDESEDEVDSISIKNSSKESVEEEKLPPKSNISDQTSKNKNKESIITKLLEEEKLKEGFANKARKSDSVIDEEESSLSETATDSGSETETSLEQQSQMKKQSGSNQLALQTNQQKIDNCKTVQKQVVQEPTDAELAQQSLQSMEALLVANPTILQQLKEDLQGLVGRRLQGLGVDPAWVELPSSIFRNKMAVLAHQRQITAKNHKIYFTLRDKLNLDAETGVRNRPNKSTADSLLARLRKKAALVADAAKFTDHLERLKKKSSSIMTNSAFFNKSQPIASSSRQESPHHSNATHQEHATFITPKLQSGDSTSLSSSTSEDSKEDPVSNVTRRPTATSDSGSHKSALRNAVSTGNLTKKKVLFVDEAIKDDKRSLSESTVAVSDSFATRLDNVSVSSLVQEIQQQLSQRSGKPANSVDLTKPTELPLSQILPLTKSGRELLESESARVGKSTTVRSSRSEPLSHILQKVPASKPSEITSSRNSEMLSRTIQKVPSSTVSLSGEEKSGFSELLSSDFKKPSPKNLLQPPKFSPTHSLTSIGSSLDISFSPQGIKNSLELDLQDLEDNLKY